MDCAVYRASYRKGTTKSTYQRPGRTSRHLVPVSLEATGEVFALDPWSGQERALDFAMREGHMEGQISIEEDELVLLAVRPNIQTSVSPAPEVCPDAESHTEDSAITGRSSIPDSRGGLPAEEEAPPIQWKTLTLQEFLPNTPEEKSFLRSGFAKEAQTIRLDGLKPWLDFPDVPETFAGRGIYQGFLTLAQKGADCRYLLCLGDVCDTFTVTINGIRTSFPDQVKKEVDITKEIQEGENTIEVEVVSNLYNRLRKDYAIPGVPIPIPYTPKKYGIWESKGKEVCIRIIR